MTEWLQFLHELEVVGVAAWAMCIAVDLAGAWLHRSDPDTASIDAHTRQYAELGNACRRRDHHPQPPEGPTP